MERIKLVVAVTALFAALSSIIFGLAWATPVQNKSTLENNEGVTDLKAGNFDDAIDHLEKAVSARPNYALGRKNLGVALNNRGLAYVKKEKYELALDDFDRALQYAPDNETALENKASCLSLMRRYQPAFDIYDKLMARNPDAKGIKERRMRCLINLKQFGRVIEECSKADMDEIKPYYRCRGIAYLSLNESEKALADFNKYFEPGRKQSDFDYLLLSITYQRLGDSKQSADYEAKMKAYPTYQADSEKLVRLRNLVTRRIEQPKLAPD